MQRVIVASKNPVKIEATEWAFQAMFPDDEFTIEGLDVLSGVADQPMSNDETLAGARNRTRNAQRQVPNADYWVGLEGGLEEGGDRLEAFAWMVVVSATEKESTARTSTFIIPDKMAELVRQGMELGAADDIVSGRENSKQGSGTVGYLTGGAVPRSAYYEQAMIMALIPHKHPELYP